MSTISGLHHVTAMASQAQENLDFYTGLLGLRLVKKTINFDAPNVYHLYYGDGAGNPGSIMTFFPFPNLSSGRKGKGQVTVTAFSIPGKSLDYWIRRLEKYGVPFKEPQETFEDEVRIYLEDPDGLGIELVANNRDQREGFTYGHIPVEYAVKGFYGVTLTQDGYERTAALLTVHMGHRVVAERGNLFRLSASGVVGDHIDILCLPDKMRGLPGSGTVHHVAFATPTDATQLEVQEKLRSAGFDVTSVLDRQYFHSIYFREPGGVLFEVATSDIGFQVDEELSKLGESLKLPSWQEGNRESIESNLEPVFLNVNSFAD